MKTTNEVLSELAKRRSIRKYTDEPIAPEVLEAIVNAGLLSAAGRGIRPWQLVVIEDRATLSVLSEARDGGSAKMLAGAAAAILVLADAAKADTWIEDCSIVMANMHLAASSLGVGSCWIQGRMRYAPDGRTTEDYVLEAIGAQGTGLKLEAMLSLGVPAEVKSARVVDDDLLSHVQYGAFEPTEEDATKVEQSESTSEESDSADRSAAQPDQQPCPQSDEQPGEQVVFECEVEVGNEIPAAQRVKGAAQMAAGAAIAAVGVPMMVLPGPGVAAIAGGAALVGKGYENATGETLLDENDPKVQKAKEVASAAKDYADEKVVPKAMEVGAVAVDAAVDVAKVAGAGALDVAKAGGKMISDLLRSK